MNKKTSPYTHTQNSYFTFCVVWYVLFAMAINMNRYMQIYVHIIVVGIVKFYRNWQRQSTSAMNIISNSDMNHRSNGLVLEWYHAIHTAYFGQIRNVFVTLFLFRSLFLPTCHESIHFSSVFRRMVDPYDVTLFFDSVFSNFFCRRSQCFDVSNGRRRAFQIADWNCCMCTYITGLTV